MDTIWLSISSGKGPEECAYVSTLTVKALLKELQSRPELNTKASIIDSEPSNVKENIRSALLALEGTDVKAFVESWGRNHEIAEGEKEWLNQR